VLQALTRQTPGSATVPRSLAVDWPNTEIRGFMLDVGRRWFGHAFLRDYVRHMSWFKLNTFQIHLNDNEISPPGGDWSKAYSAFRLASDDPRYAGLAAEDGAFTRADWDRLEDVAADSFVTLVPEIDAPAHARSFIAFDPSLGLDGGNSDHLDLSKPATTAFMKGIYDEFAPWFRGPALHIGADEYPREYEPRYRAYVNDIAAHVRGLGKEVRAWGSLSVMAGGAGGYDRDMTMHSWNNGWYGPRSAVADGYPVVNTNDSLLYIVPFADYYHGRGLDGRWLFDNWEPHVFPGGQSLAPGEPLRRGAMSAVWNDLVHADYDGADVHGLVEPTFGLLAQKMWRGKESGQSYEDFMADVAALGVGPGMETLTSTLPGAGDRRLALTASGLPPLVAGESATVTATVANLSEHTLPRLQADFGTEADGLRVTPTGRWSKTLRSGESAVLTWTVDTAADTPTGTASARITVNGKLRVVAVGKSTGVGVRTVEAAPDGLRHLAFDATATAS
ncbi:MAG TPA: family 20 glycosylhydrolase, partial [Phytomonospora sp.]